MEKKMKLISSVANICFKKQILNLEWLPVVSQKDILKVLVDCHIFLGGLEICAVLQHRLQN